MPKKVPVSLVITGVDRVSAVMSRISKKFPELSRAVRRASTMFQILQQKTEKFRKSMMGIGRGLTNVGKTMSTHLTAPIGIAGAAVIGTAVKFQKSMNRVGALTRTIVGGVVSENFQMLEKRALELGASTEFSANQVAEAMAIMGQQGFRTNEILAATSDILALASATNVELSEAIDIAGKTMKQFGLDATEMTRISDVLALTTASTNTTMESIGETFKAAGPIAKAYGATLEQTAAITGLLGDVGIQGSLAGTALKNIFLQLATPTAKGTALLKAMQIDALDPVTKQMRSVGEVLTLLGPKLAGLNKNKQLEVMNELFGLRGIAGATALMEKAFREGKDPVAAMTKTLENATGTAKDMQQTLLRGAPGALARFQSAFEGAGLAIAKSGLLEAFASILDDLAQMFSKLSQVSPALLKLGTIFVGIVAVIGPFLAALGFMFKGIALLLPVFAAFKSLMVGIATILAGVSLPIIAIVAGIGLLIAGVTRAILAWDQLVNAFKSGKGVMDTVSKVFKTFFGFGGEEKKIALEKTVGVQAALGPAKGAIAAQQALGPMSRETTNNAKIDVMFGNVPKGTKVRSEATGPLGLNLGFSGGIQ